VPSVVEDIVRTAPDGGELAVEDARGAVTRVSWARLHARARRMATVLATAGVTPGSRVGLLADTGVELVTALQAVWLSGAAVTLLPPPARAETGHAERLCGIIADAGLVLVVVDESMAGLAPALGRATRVLALTELVGLAAHAPPAPIVVPAPDDLAVLQYTSGSTRSPRGVPVRHDQLAANLAAITEALDHGRQQPLRMLSWLPLHHDMGLVGFCVLPMSLGCPLTLQSPLGFLRRPASWLRAVARERATVTGAPNFAYGLATRFLTGERLDLRSVRTMISGGEPVDPALMARFVAAAAPSGLDPAAVSPAYGLAEATLAVSFAHLAGIGGVRVDAVDPVALETAGRAVPREGGRPLVRLGRPVAGTRIRVTDGRTGEPVPDRVVGRVEVAGPSVVRHYWNEPPTASPWLTTGDLGYLVDGELVVCGREKDVLFAAGRNIYPQDVEAAVASVATVRQGCVAAFGVDERLVVAVESTSDGEVEAVRHAVAAAVLAEVGLTPAAVAVLPPGHLPKTSSGKLRRADTRARYLAGTLIPARERQLR